MVRVGSVAVVARAIVVTLCLVNGGLWTGDGDILYLRVGARALVGVLLGHFGGDYLGAEMFLKTLCVAVLCMRMSGRGDG